MKIYYDETVKYQIRDAVEYGRQQFGPFTATRFRARLKSVIQGIKHSPMGGKIEHNLSNEAHVYRSVTMSPFKIIYSVAENSVRIHQLWNMRKNPDDIIL